LQILARSIAESIYGRCIKDELLFSSDLMEWMPFMDFMTGNFSVGLSVNERQPALVIGGETNRRV
jgi:hypothetical protein